MTTVDRPLKKTKLVSLPSKIIEEILSRLPVRSILRFRCVCKAWLSIISNPSFTKLQLSRATVRRRTGLFISAYDHPTRKRYLFGAHDFRPLTYLMSDDKYGSPSGVTHVNGLVCYTINKLVLISNIYRRHRLAFLFNPSTRKTYELPPPPVSKTVSNTKSSSEYVHVAYLFWFDDSTNQHKILLVARDVHKNKADQFFIFSMSSHSWKKVDAGPPADLRWHLLFKDFDGGSVCVNSVVHIMFQEMPFDILAFDFVREKFSFVSIPQAALPRDYNHDQDKEAANMMKRSITKIDGCLGVVFHDRKSSEVQIWLLQDYDNRVCVSETIKFPQSWNEFVGNYPLSIDVNMDDEIVFSVGKVSGYVMTIPVYNRKSKCFKSLHFLIDHHFVHPGSVKFNLIKCYAESIMPL